MMIQLLNLLYCAEVVVLVLSLRVLKNAWEERWERRAFVPTVAILAIAHIWCWGLGYLVPPVISVLGDILVFIGLWPLERWLNKRHYRGPLGVARATLAEAFDLILSHLPAAGLRTQDRTCPWNEIDNEGHIVLGTGQKLSILALEPPKRPLRWDEKGRLAEPELNSLVLALAKEPGAFKILRFTRPLNVDGYAERLRQLWHENRQDDEVLEPVLKEHLSTLQPHLIEGRDPLWPLSLATMTVIVIEADEEFERRLIAIGRRAGVKIRKLNTYEVVALMRQHLNYEVLSLEPDRVEVQTQKHLKDLIAPARFRVGHDSIEIASQGDERSVFWGFATVAMTGETEVSVIAEVAAKCNLDCVVGVKPLDAFTEANLLANRRKVTKDDLDLAAEYKAGKDHPAELRVLLVFRATSQEELRRSMKDISRQVTAHYRGVVIRPIRGPASVEAAFQASLPLLTSVTAPPLKQPATEVTETLISVGEMELKARPPAVHIGQDETSLPLFAQFHNFLEEETKGSQNTAIIGTTGLGKTFFRRWTDVQALLCGGLHTLAVFDLKAKGDERRVAKTICPQGMKLVIIHLNDDSIESMNAILNEIGDEDQLYIVVEARSLGEEKSLLRMLLAKVMAWVYERACRTYHLGHTKTVFEDAYTIVRDPDDQAGNMMLEFFRKGGSFYIYNTLVFQDPGDAVMGADGSNRIGSECLTQCGRIVFFQVNPDSAALLHNMGVPLSTARVIASFNPGDLCYFEPATLKCDVARLWVTDELVRLMKRSA